MNGKKFILFFLGIFILGASPIVILQPTGAASAGLSAGFVLIFEHPAILLFVLAAGILTALIARDALITIPVCLLAMLSAGQMLGLSPDRFATAPYGILASLLLVAFITGVTARKTELFGQLIAASIGFHLGWHGVHSIPDIASPLYFLIGMLLGTLLALAVFTSLSLTLLGDDSRLGRYLRESPKLAPLRTAFGGGEA